MNKPKQKQRREHREQIPFTDDLMFSLVMRDTEICREFLQLVLPEEKFGEIKITSPEDPLFGEVTSEPQKSMKFVPDMHGVRLDVYIKSDRSWAEIEMQTSTESYLGKRSRFYQSNMDLDCLEEGQDYRKLKKSYVIFFCTFDAFHLDEPLYFFQTWDHEKGLKLNDFSYKLLINTKCSEKKVPEKLKPLFAYVNGTEDFESSDLVKKIDQRVKKFNSDEWRKKFMTFEYYVKEKAEQAYEDGQKVGREEGAAQEKREIAKNLKESGIPIDVIAKNTGLTPKEIAKL